MAETLLSVEDLSVSFHGPRGAAIAAVKGVSFTVNPGEIVAMVGESGSGKSVSALSVMRLLPGSAFHPSGKITFEGKDVLAMSPRELHAMRGSRIGMIFQEPMTALNPLHTIGKQIGECLRTHSERGTWEVSRVTELLDLVGLPHFKDRLDAYPHQLSGGERQRVMIAMAVANNPALLIADEPTTALDVTVQAQILKLIRDLQKRLNMAVLLITHDLTLVRRMADRVMIMSQGVLVESGPTQEIFTSPKHAYTQKLLSSEPKGEAIVLPANAPPIISCEQLSVKFPRKKNFWGTPIAWNTAVDQVGITVKEGECLGVVGESGSGKTTLALALLRLLRSDGPIVYLGNRIESLGGEALRSLRKDMQIVFQDPFSSLSPRMSISDIITEGLRLHFPKKTSAEREAEVDAILTTVGLAPEMKERYPHELSGGQRQRVSIARAMVLKPRFVVLDEPTSALDLSVQSQIIALLRELQASHRLAYLFISHDLRVVRAMAHRIVVMKNGKIVEEGNTLGLFVNPQQAYTKALIEAAFIQ